MLFIIQHDFQKTLIAVLDQLHQVYTQCCSCIVFDKKWNVNSGELIAIHRNELTLNFTAHFQKCLWLYYYDYLFIKLFSLYTITRLPETSKEKSGSVCTDLQNLIIWTVEAADGGPFVDHLMWSWCALPSRQRNFLNNTKKMRK